MSNKSMARKLRKGEAVDVSGFNRTPDGDLPIAGLRRGHGLLRRQRGSVDILVVGYFE
jgi:hypothetical protein